MKGKKRIAKAEARRKARATAKAERGAASKKDKQEHRHMDELREAARPNIEKSMASIRASSDEKWLRGFRERAQKGGETQIVAAIDARLAELEESKFRRRIGAPQKGLSLKERVRESVRVYEEFLLKKHGRHIRAARTNKMIRDWGEKEAVRRTVANLNMSTGLELLAKYGRLDCSYEQIILDFPEEFDEALRAKAKANLARLPPGGIGSPGLASLV